MKLKYFIAALILLGYSNHVIGQQVKTITGRLVTTNNEPVANATISLQSKSINAQSGANGHFSLPYNGNADTLSISHIGYISIHLPIDAFTAFPLIIEFHKKENTLDEVIVNTGYQQLHKERSTGSFTQINNSTFNQQVGSDVMSRLPAIANGLSEGRKANSGSYSSSGKFLIRGLSTINGPTSPLIILDNFPYEGDLQNINPNDVESITLLKDAAAASIWGARAGNGVIVITTKKGKFNQKLKVEFNTNLKITQKPDLFYAQSISSSDLIDVEEFLFSKNYRFSDILSSSHPPFSPVYEILFRERNGQISPAEAASQINVFRNHDVRDDFDKYVYKEAVNQQYALNIRGGSDNIAWILSGGFDKNLDVLSAGYNRISLRSDNTIKLSKRLQLNTSLYFTESKNISGKEGYGNIRSIKGSIPIYSQLVDDNGNQVPVAKDYRQSYLDTAGGGKLPDWNYYPLEDYKHTRTTSNVQDLIGNLSLSYIIFAGLTANVKYQYEKQMITGKALSDQDSYYARNLINTFYQPTGSNNFPIPKGGILDVSNNSITSNNFRGQLNFSKSWRNNEIVAIAGSELKQLTSNGISYRMYGYDDNILSKVPVDMINSYKSFVTGSSIRIPDFSGLDETITRFVSFYANAAYTYQEKYTVSMSGRRDASNIFGINTNDKWNPLWSAGASWLLSNENFYSSQLFPFLKFRATYGVSGNIDLSLSAATTMRYSSTSPYTMLPYGQVDKFSNPDLRWEKNRQLNLGVDFSSKNGRFAGSIDYYIKKGNDLYGPSPLDQTTGLGIGYIQKNAADMIAKGMDFEINSLNINKKIKWSSGINLSIYHDKVTSYYLATSDGSNFVSDGISITGLIGKPVNSVLSYKWAGLDPLTGDPRGYLNGEISKDYNNITFNGTTISDLIYSGSALPTMYGSIGNTINYKALSINARVGYKFGHYFKKSSLKYSSLFSSLNSSADYADRWQETGDEKFTNIPSLVYPAIGVRDAFYNESEILVEKGDQIRLQYITLSYEISKTKFKNLPFENIRLYVNLNDVGVIWRANKVGLDPDYRIGSIPPSKNIALGTRINF